MVRKTVLQQFQPGRLTMYKAYGWVTCSALLLIVPLYIPHLWYLIFIAHIPIFYAANNYPLTFLPGFWWGLLCWTGHLSALFYGVYEHGYGAFRLIFPLFLIIYCALYSGLTFCIAAWLSTKKNREVVWVVGITLYYLVMRYTILWIIGVPSGYPLALPLLLLAEYPKVLALLPYVTSSGLLLCLLTSAMSSAVYCTTKKRSALVLSLCTLFPFCIGWFIRQGTAPLELAAITVSVCPSKPDSTMHLWDRAQEINACIAEQVSRRPETQIIILPESSYPFALNKQRAVVDLWGNNALSNNQLLIIGAYAQEEEDTYNGIYGIRGCRIIFNYVKMCRMPFTEYIPFPWSTFACLRTLFLKNKNGFSSKEISRVVSLTDTQRVQLAVCSEFFFDAYDPYEPLPLLVLVNDSWFSCTYIRHLMYLFARYTAIERSLDIIYTSYDYATYMAHNKKDFYESILT